LHVCIPFISLNDFIINKLGLNFMCALRIHIVPFSSIVSTYSTGNLHFFLFQLVRTSACARCAQDKGIIIRCEDVVVLIYREQGAKEAASSVGIRLWSLTPFKNQRALDDLKIE
jgi:hypothetical protein